MKNTFILSAKRTPIGKYGGGLSSLTAPDLGTHAAQAALEAANISPEKVDETIFGHGRQVGSGPNPARQVAIRAGVPETSPAYTVNQACASGLKSIALATDAIALGRAECMLAGGMEAMSRMPYMLDTGARWGYKLGHQPLIDLMYRDGFMCPISNMLMGATADFLAKEYGITREACDEYSVGTQKRCEQAVEAGRFSNEMLTITIPSRKGDIIIDKDEHPRPEANAESMAKLKPVFDKDGVVTAANASGITDGAAALVIGSEAAMKESGAEPLARVVDYTSVGVDPKLMGIGPVPAVNLLLERTKLSLDDIDLFEMNEAFAAQVLACLKDLPIPVEKMNVNGGAIALGHPIGCTGARIVVTLVHEMKRRNVKRGIATLCVSGGMGFAMLLERE